VRWRLIIALLSQCAQQVFGGRKTYQALKGAFERSYAVFKQVYLFEQFTAHLGDPNANANMSIPAVSTQEYERRMQAARDKGFDPGTLNTRIIEQWHRLGWYDLFYTRSVGYPCVLRDSHPQGDT
jgi:hypothetical protein